MLLKSHINFNLYTDELDKQVLYKNIQLNVVSSRNKNVKYNVSSGIERANFSN